MNGEKSYDFKSTEEAKISNQESEQVPSLRKSKRVHEEIPDVQNLFQETGQ